MEWSFPLTRGLASELHFHWYLSNFNLTRLLLSGAIYFMEAGDVCPRFLFMERLVSSDASFPGLASVAGRPPKVCVLREFHVH